MEHEIIADLNWRHTVKAYDKNKKVNTQDLAVLFEAIRLSPSSINSQPWRFVVIESQEAKKRMSDTFTNNFQFNQPHVMNSSEIILFAYNPKYSRSDYAEVIDQDIANGRTKDEDREGAFGAFFFA